MNKNILKRAVSFAAAIVMTVSVMSGEGIDLFADTQSELEARQQELANERSDVEKDLAKYKSDAEETEEYLAEYDRKMKLQEEQIDNLDEQIKLYNDELEGLAAEIEAHEAEVDNGVQKHIYFGRRQQLCVAASRFYGFLRHTRPNGICRENIQARQRYDRRP